MSITITVRPGLAEIGICSKEERGIITESQNVPSGLSRFETSLACLALKLKMDFDDKLTAPDVQSAIQRYEANLDSDPRNNNWPGLTM